MSQVVIGLTGGVASGKSAVAARFAHHGAFICDADDAARAAVAPGSAGLTEVVTAFGAEILNADGSLNRALMRQRIFTDAITRRTLEAIIHPRVRRAMQAACAAADAVYAIAVIPLLVESGREAYPWLERILLIDTPLEVQLARLVGRDGIDEALARQMIAAQASRAERLALADDVLLNDGPLDALEAPVATLDARYRKLGAAGLLVKQKS